MTVGVLIEPALKDTHGCASLETVKYIMIYFMTLDKNRPKTKFGLIQNKEDCSVI